MRKRAFGGVNTLDLFILVGLAATLSLGMFSLVGKDLPGMLAAVEHAQKNPPKSNELLGLADSNNPLDSVLKKNTKKYRTPTASFIPPNQTPQDYMNLIWQDNETICTDDYCVQIPIIQEGDLDSSLGMGGDLTDALSTSIMQFALQLKGKRRVDQGLVIQIRELANLGHAIAEEQRKLDRVIEKRCDYRSLCTFPVGKGAIDFIPLQDANSDGTPDAVPHFKQVASDIDGFVNDMNERALPPGVFSLINLEASMIVHLAEGTPWLGGPDGIYAWAEDDTNEHVYDRQSDGDGRVVVSMQDLDDYLVNSAALPGQDAFSICNSGKGGPRCRAPQ